MRWVVMYDIYAAPVMCARRAGHGRGASAVIYDIYVGNDINGEPWAKPPPARAAGRRPWDNSSSTRVRNVTYDIYGENVIYAHAAASAAKPRSRSVITSSRF